MIKGYPLPGLTISFQEIEQGGAGLSKEQIAEVAPIPLDLPVLRDPRRPSSEHRVQLWACPVKHAPQLECFGYVFREPDSPGVLDSKMALELGAKGRQLGQLKVDTCK